MAVRRPLPRALLRQELARIREALDAHDLETAQRLAHEVVQLSAPAGSAPRRRRRPSRRARPYPTAASAAPRRLSPPRRRRRRRQRRPPRLRAGRLALTSLLLAKLSLLGVLATFLALFVGIPRGAAWRRLIFGALVVFTALLGAFSLGALRSSGGTASRLTHHLPLLGAAGLVFLVYLAAVTWLVWRYPDWAMPAVIVLAPLRVGLPLGSSTSNLLVPLYVVLLAIALAEMVIRDRLTLPEGWRPDPVRVALAVMIAVVGVSALWVGQRYAPHPKAFADALIDFFAFFLPFAVLYYVLYRYTRDAARLARLLITFLGAGVVLAVIGIVQYPLRQAIFNRAGVAHEIALGQPFRASSLFWDPNIFGRFLALAMLVGTAFFLTARLRAPGEGRRRAMWLAVAAVALAAIAFVVTFSRSSVAGLLLGALVLEMAWLGRRKGSPGGARDRARPGRGPRRHHRAARPAPPAHQARHDQGH